MTAVHSQPLYYGQSGALNESMSDVFGSLDQAARARPDRRRGRLADRRRAASRRASTARPALDEGAGHRVRRRRARQGPAAGPHGRLRQHHRTTAASTSTRASPTTPSTWPRPTLGGYAWEKAGRIWYETLRDSALRTNTGFKRFANLTVATATRLYGPRASNRRSSSMRGQRWGSPPRRRWLRFRGKAANDTGRFRRREPA